MCIRDRPEVDIPDPFADAGQTKEGESISQDEVSNDDSKPEWEWWDEG